MSNQHDDPDHIYTVSINDDTTASGYPLTYIQESFLTNNDVLSGSGNHTNRWPGNIQYRRLVDGRRDDYSRAARGDKKPIAISIVREIRQLHPPGRFLKKDLTTGYWHDIGDEGDSGAIEKTSRLLRQIRD